MHQSEARGVGELLRDKTHPSLAAADLIGLDVLLAVMQTIHDEFGDSEYRPCPLLREMVAGLPRP